MFLVSVSELDQPGLQRGVVVVASNQTLNLLQICHLFSRRTTENTLLFQYRLGMRSSFDSLFLIRLDGLVKSFELLFPNQMTVILALYR